MPRVTRTACFRAKYLAILVALAGFAIHGCVDRPATEIVVRIASDIPAADLVGVELLVHPPGQATPERFRRSYGIGTGSDAHSIPGEVGLVAADNNDSSRIQVDVVARLRGAEGFTRSAIVAFQPGRILVLEMFLAQRCRSEMARRDCDAMQMACGRDRCETMFPELPLLADAGLDVALEVFDAPTLDAADAMKVVDVAPVVDASDAGRDITDVTLDAPDSPSCTPGTPCTASVLCRTAAIDCTSGSPVCTDNGVRTAGTECGLNAVCNASGMCVPCTVGEMCGTGPCVTHAIACASGEPVCSPTGNLPPGSVCPGGVCDGAGTCTPCSAGASCSTGDPCTTGTIGCMTGMSVCMPTGNSPIGTPCPGGGCNGAGACAAGVCANGMLDPGEQCDDSNTSPGDGCGPMCMLESIAADNCPGIAITALTGTTTHYRSNTTGAIDDFTSSCSAGTPDVVYAITVGAGATVLRVIARWTGSLQPALLYRGTFCPGVAVSCSMANSTDRFALVSINGVRAGTTYYFVVDGVAGSSGDFVLTVVLS